MKSSLSPMSGRLLDGRSPFQAVLAYPIRALNADLDECGSGHKLKVVFETLEHAKNFSGSVSHADLGIVFRYENPAFGEQVEKAILVECKRLYPLHREYKLRSRYEGFDPGQFAALESIDSSGGTKYYFLYNPVLEAFGPTDASLIRALENRMTRLAAGAYVHPVLLEEFYMRFGPRYLRGLLPAMDPFHLTNNDEARKLLAESAVRRPGLPSLVAYINQGSYRSRQEACTGKVHTGRLLQPCARHPVDWNIRCHSIRAAVGIPCGLHDGLYTRIDTPQHSRDGVRQNSGR